MTPRGRRGAATARLALRSRAQVRYLGAMSRRSLSSPIAKITKPRIVAAFAASAALLGWAPKAAACDCAPFEGLQPSSTSQKVPTNTKVWLSAFGCDAAELRKSDGTPVPTALTTIDGTRVLHPDAPLEMGATYQVFCFEEPATTFTVSEGIDNEPPPTPAVSTLDAESSSGGFSSCGSYEYVPLLADQTDLILTLDIAGRASLDPAAVSGEVSDVFFRTASPSSVTPSARRTIGISRATGRPPT